MVTRLLNLLLYSSLVVPKSLTEIIPMTKIIEKVKIVIIFLKKELFSELLFKSGKLNKFLSIILYIYLIEIY
tara:strand:- start:956 stop:1171 length:216 start_codon:yes stop_codon:yes gene_type:complete